MESSIASINSYGYTRKILQNPMLYSLGLSVVKLRSSVALSCSCREMQWHHVIMVALFVFSLHIPGVPWHSDKTHDHWSSPPKTMSALTPFHRSCEYSIRSLVTYTATMHGPGRLMQVNPLFLFPSQILFSSLTYWDLPNNTVFRITLRSERDCTNEIASPDSAQQVRRWIRDSQR